ncbi:hypothetical protein FD755_005752 [Muntiacus reevesi]|uniref:Mos1 transposase HTH domain-containing protein n=1 Tax=Muntiacus reevesi TaxID=9886 RepID=A0A5J5MUG2_MUNRE|nr:hypothetical protein FD755_005752 [Muntiacus reevesi]
MMLDKKQIQAIFLFELKMGCKAVETSCNINNTFGPRTYNAVVVHEEFSDWPLEVDKQLREIIEADPLTTTQEVAKDLNINHSMAVWHLKQTGELIKNQKTHPFEVSSSFILHNNKNEPFLGQIVMCDGKWTLYDNQR